MSILQSDESRVHTDRDWMVHALELAHHAQQCGEVPVGALLVADDAVLGEGWNSPIGSIDPTAHAEVRAIRAAAESVGNYRLPGTTLYVTLEPCPMCAGAIVQARIQRVVFAAHDPRAGAAGSQFQLLQNNVLNHRCEVTAGVLAEESSALLKAFFQQRRQRLQHTRS